MNTEPCSSKTSKKRRRPKNSSIPKNRRLTGEDVHQILNKRGEEESEEDDEDGESGISGFFFQIMYN